IYPVLAFTQTANRWLIGSALGLESFAYGFGALGVMLFMLQQIAPGRHPMAHYAFATSFMSIGLFAPGLLGGWLSEVLGFTGFFVWVVASSLPSLSVVLGVPLEAFRRARLDQSSHDLRKAAARARSEGSGPLP